MRWKKIGKCSLVLIVYSVVLIWIGNMIWGTPKSTYEKLVRKNHEVYAEQKNRDGIKYSLTKQYITTSDYFLLEIAGYEVEKVNEIGKFTVKSIILQNDSHSYLVEIVREKLEYAARYAGCEVETDKIAYRAVVPMASLENGCYKIGFLLTDGTVLWTSEKVSAQPYFELFEDGDDSTSDNELAITSDRLWYNSEFDYLEGTGGDVGAELKIYNRNDSNSMKVSIELISKQPDSYFVFTCNDVTVMYDPEKQEQIAEMVFPIKDDKNYLYIYYLSEQNAAEMEKANYIIEDIDIEFSDETIDFWKSKKQKG